ncbi:MAG: hypothetical protein IPL54_09680 [Chitinophagaceae bacterium]|nr:hypothetical protein [Chitinophagaceae bacterium]
MTLVEVKGVKYPIYTDQTDFPYFKMFSQNLRLKKRRFLLTRCKERYALSKVKKVTVSGFHSAPVFDKDIFDDDIVENLVYLVNQMETAYTFTYNLMIGGETAIFQPKGYAGAFKRFLPPRCKV